MADQSVTPVPHRSKMAVVSLEGARFLLYLGTVVVAVVVFMWTSQASQDTRISTNCTAIDRNTTRHDEHTRNAMQTFDKLDRTLTAQQELMTKTRESLVRLEVAQERLAHEVQNLTAEVRKRAP